MRDLDLKMLGEVVKSPVQQVPEEHQLLQHCLVCLPQVARPQGIGKFVQKLLIVLVIELLL